MSITPELLRASWRSWANQQTQGVVGPAWLQWVWTLLFSIVIAAAFTVLGTFKTGWDLQQLAVWFGRNFVVSLCIGVLIQAGYDVLGRVWATRARLARWQVWQRSVYFSGVALAGVALGWPLGMTLIGADLQSLFGDSKGRPIIIGSVAFSAVVTLVLHFHFAGKARQYQAEQQATEARLRLLQGQIEPHFLFNTLANVQSLIDFDPARAKQMLERFTDYLRSSLVQLRGETTTLGQEFSMLEAYLGLMQLRMGSRLQVVLDLPADLAGFALPPLLLQPLVENAVHHGLEPMIEGGTVSVTASAANGRVCIVISDDGQGLDGGQRRRGNGMALENIRDRLKARFGGDASLELAPRDGGGTQACIQIPMPDPSP